MPRRDRAETAAGDEGPGPKKGKMAIGLVHLFEAGLLLMNAAAILNEKRFLRKYGLDSAVVGENLGPKNQVASFLHAMRTFMRYPLVAMNVLVIIYEMILG